MNLDPLDELPIHQVPLSFAAVGTSDHNFYDRCIYQAVAHDNRGTGRSDKPHGPTAQSAAPAKESVQ